jgi:hypothetical protein
MLTTEKRSTQKQGNPLKKYNRPSTMLKTKHLIPNKITSEPKQKCPLRASTAPAAAENFKRVKTL